MTEVVDGTGAPARRADVAVVGDRIAAVEERFEGTAARELDARGRIVTPGFVDIHTHLDAQLAWDPLPTSSCWHGVTSAVLGNCGVTFAPVADGGAEVLAEMMESVEDIPRRAILEGLPWDWTTYGEYLDWIDRIPKGSNQSFDAVEEMLDDPVVTLGLADAGAHVGQIMDSSQPTYLLTHWMRDRGRWTLPDAVRRLTSDTADLFGIADRGRLVAGPTPTSTSSTSTSCASPSRSTSTTSPTGPAATCSGPRATTGPSSTARCSWTTGSTPGPWPAGRCAAERAGPIDLSVCVASNISDIDHVVEAERLGFARAWFADSQMIWSDPYACLALAAVRTSTIGLGTGVAEVWDDYRPLIERVPAGRRHLRIHQGHNCWVVPEEERFLTRALIDQSCLVGTVDELVERIGALEADGLDEIMVLPPLEPRAEVIGAIGRRLIPALG